MDGYAGGRCGGVLSNFGQFAGSDLSWNISRLSSTDTDRRTIPISSYNMM